MQWRHHKRKIVMCFLILEIKCGQTVASLLFFCCVRMAVEMKDVRVFDYLTKLPAFIHFRFASYMHLQIVNFAMLNRRGFSTQLFDDIICIRISLYFVWVVRGFFFWNLPEPLVPLKFNVIFMCIMNESTSIQINDGTNNKILHFRLDYIL